MPYGTKPREHALILPFLTTMVHAAEPTMQQCSWAVQGLQYCHVYAPNA